MSLAVNTSNLNNLWYGYAAMNDYKLSQALSAKSFQPVSEVSKVTPTLGEETAAFLKEYQGNMAELKKLSAGLSADNITSALNTMNVSSSDSSVLQATARYAVRKPAVYDVEVSQLAAAQVNQTGGLAAGEAPTAGGSLVLQTREGSFALEVDATQAATNRELLDSVAQEINLLKTGVTARVTETDGKVSLSLEGDKTGTGNGFLVSGSFGEATGLDQMSQKAQNAVYSVGSLEFTSQENQVAIGSYQIEATLTKVGSAQVTVGPDTGALADKVGKLADQYNKTIKFLAENADRGTGVLRQLRRLVQPPTSPNSMKHAGISIGNDGTYTFDKAAFTTAMDKNPALVRDIIGGSFGVAQGLERDAQAGLGMPSGSLVSSSSSANSYYPSVVQQQSAYQLLSSYSRSGAYNMLNYYAVGMMMNLGV